MENENMNPLDIKIDDIRSEIPSRLYNILEGEDACTLGDVVKLKDYEWLRCPGFGYGTLRDLRDFLSIYGLEIGGRESNVKTPKPLTQAVRLKKRISDLEETLRQIATINNQRDRYSDEIDKIILKALEI